MATKRTCGYAHPGTYGHECGGEGKFAAPLPSQRTVSGIYWAVRCGKCIQWDGPDNQGLKGKWIAYDPIAHVNQWK